MAGISALLIWQSYNNGKKINEDKLFNLFSLYGNIVRIKIMRNKPDHALVEMADGFQPFRGQCYSGRNCKSTTQKCPNITPAPDAHDCSNSSLNRLNSNVVKDYQVPTLLCSNQDDPHFCPSTTHL